MVFLNVYRVASCIYVVRVMCVYEMFLYLVQKVEPPMATSGSQP